MIDPMIRTVQEVLETDLRWLPSFDKPKNKRVFQFVQFVTGKAESTRDEYEVFQSGWYYGRETVVVRGRNGYMKLVVEPLFQEVA